MKQPGDSVVAYAGFVGVLVIRGLLFGVYVMGPPVLETPKARGALASEVTKDPWFVFWLVPESQEIKMLIVCAVVRIVDSTHGETSYSTRGRIERTAGCCCWEIPELV